MAVDIYAQEMTDILSPLMVRPVLIRDTETESSVQLKWESKILPNVTYLLQVKNVDMSSDWAIFNQSEFISKQHISVTNLQPFTTYQFRVLAVIAKNTFLESNESFPITTKAYGAPGDAPQITSLTTPSPTVISISWTPPHRPNGPLLVYKVEAVPYNRDRLRSVTKEVPANSTSWTFAQLQPSTLYTLSLSARNLLGEGPAVMKNITTPNPGNLSQRETPYLILGADNMVLRQSLISLQSQSVTLHKDQNTSILMTESVVKNMLQY
ncbi:proto-oncogene tyrosine-protein kinase ROS-like [Liolophura sinensis]|uniref:proto-oncogene tyrosine-protein kinase ROS-like n=1 Tax=Liolophura sinensis TaxID=3198878 RepID=UPI00315929F6